MSLTRDEVAVMALHVNSSLTRYAGNTRIFGRRLPLLGMKVVR